MSQSREVVQSLYGAFARGDAGFVLGLLADDVHWMEAEGSPMASGNPYTSPQQVGEGVFGRLLSVFDDFAAVPTELVVEEDRIVAFGRYAGVDREPGTKLDAPFAHSWTLADGRVVAFQQYTDTEQHARIMG